MLDYKRTSSEVIGTVRQISGYSKAACLAGELSCIPPIVRGSADY
jgi:hypothetical protein